MLDKKARGILRKDFKTLKISDISSSFGSSCLGSFKFERKTYILIACFSFIYLNFILKSHYYYLVVKLSAVNDELSMPIMPIMIN